MDFGEKAIHLKRSIHALNLLWTAEKKMKIVENNAEEVLLVHFANPVIITAPFGINLMLE